MNPWTPDIDLSTIPDAVLYAEAGRRARAKVAPENISRAGGRPKKLSRCPNCRLRFGVAEMRKHKLGCLRSGANTGQSPPSVSIPLPRHDK